MAKYSPEFKEQVKQAYLSSGDSLATIAARFGVGERTIENWSKEGSWDTRRKAQKVIPIGEAKSKSQPTAATIDPPPQREAAPSRSRRQRGDIDEIELIELAVADVSGAMSTAASEDLRSLGALAGALVKLLEYRRKIAPPTAAELADQVIALGVSPSDLVRELKTQWAERA
jgi:transposase-like protein